MAFKSQIKKFGSGADSQKSPFLHRCFFKYLFQLRP